MYTTDYELMLLQMKSLMEGVEYDITNLANASALIYESMEGLNWAGFYLYRNGELVLGQQGGRRAGSALFLPLAVSSRPPPAPLQGQRVTPQFGSCLSAVAWLNWNGLSETKS